MKKINPNIAKAVNEIIIKAPKPLMITTMNLIITKMNLITISANVIFVLHKIIFLLDVSILKSVSDDAHLTKQSGNGITQTLGK